MAPRAPHEFHGPVASIVIAALVVASSLVLTRLADRHPVDDAGGAAAYLAADGATTWMGDGETSVTVETQFAQGGQAFLSTPPHWC